MIRLWGSLNHRRLAERAAKSVGLAYYGLFLGPRGWGRTSSVDTVERQYRTGYWDHFETLRELPRYAILASLIRHLDPGASVLDVGCGYGTLAAELDTGRLEGYVGIDQSLEAINRARTAAYQMCSFEVADFHSWDSGRKFKLIVFNETAYYADRPVALIERYADMLTEDGLILVAMFRHRNTMVIWKNIARRFAILDNVEVKNSHEEITDIRVLAKRRAEIL